MTAPESSIPWYRHRWPWLLMAGPAAVVVASLATAWIAWGTSDGLVTENYYKEGLAVGETIAQSAKATEWGVIARMTMTADAVKVSLSGDAGAGYATPKAVKLTLSHPTRAGLDQSQVLPAGPDGYSGKLHLPASGHWLVLIEDDSKSWRLMASVSLPAMGETVIGGKQSAAIAN